MNITEFLEARITEDEEAAKTADSGRWLAEGKGITFEFYGDEFPEGEAQLRLVSDTNANMNHIANWNPTRVLAECAAKRAILSVIPATREERGKAQNQIVEALAAIYRDHPDYQEAWAL